jgi:hypothetical protein
MNLKEEINIDSNLQTFLYINRYWKIKKINFIKV